MANVRFCSTSGLKVDVKDLFYINCRSIIKSTENEKEIEKAKTNTKSLNEYYLFEKKNKRRNHKVTQEASSVD